MNWSEFLNVIDKIINFTLFTVDQTPITVSSLIIFFVLFLTLLFLSRFVSQLFANKILSRLRINQATIYTFKRIIYYVLVAISAIFSFQFVGINLSGLAVIFGLLSVGIGFGLQNITSNFISGIILLFERPIKVGDRVTVGGTEGDVIAINMRSTTIRSLENIFIIVPNSDFISSQVINWSYSDPKVRLNIDVGVSYNSDVDLVKNALLEVAEENNNVLERPAPQALLLGFGDSAWNMQLRAWIHSPKRQYIIRSDLNSAIVKKFRDRGIEIPYPQRDLNFRNSLPSPVAIENIAVHNDGKTKD